MDKIFADGFNYVEKQIPSAPWIKAQIGIKKDKFQAFMDAHTDDRGWVNLTVKESKGGKLYVELDTYKKLEKPEGLLEPEKPKSHTIDIGSIPF